MNPSNYKEFDVEDDSSSSSHLVVPMNQFELDAADGFTSSNFDLLENIRNQDQRDGLDDSDKHRVRNLMSEGHDFDNARLELNRQRMRDAGVDPDTGLPLDPRAVTFENLRRMTDTSFRGKIKTLMQRMRLSPRRIVAILILLAIGYWIFHYSEWQSALGLAQPLFMGSEDLGIIDEPADSGT